MMHPEPEPLIIDMDTGEATVDDVWLALGKRQLSTVVERRVLHDDLMTPHSLWVYTLETGERRVALFQADLRGPSEVITKLTLVWDRRMHPEDGAVPVNNQPDLRPGCVPDKRVYKVERHKLAFWCYKVVCYFEFWNYGKAVHNPPVPYVVAAWVAKTDAEERCAYLNDKYANGDYDGKGFW